MHEEDLIYQAKRDNENIPKFLDVAMKLGMKETILLFKQTYVSEHEIYLHC